VHLLDRRNVRGRTSGKAREKEEREGVRQRIVLGIKQWVAEDCALITVEKVSIVEQDETTITCEDLQISHSERSFVVFMEWRPRAVVCTVRACSQQQIHALDDHAVTRSRRR
jgi:hypothetical protein